MVAQIEKSKPEILDPFLRALVAAQDSRAVLAPTSSYDDFQIISPRVVVGPVIRATPGEFSLEMHFADAVAQSAVRHWRLEADLESSLSGGMQWRFVRRTASAAEGMAEAARILHAFCRLPQSDELSQPSEPFVARAQLDAGHMQLARALQQLGLLHRGRSNPFCMTTASLGGTLASWNGMRLTLQSDFNDTRLRRSADRTFLSAGTKKGSNDFLNALNCFSTSYEPVGSQAFLKWAQSLQRDRLIAQPD
ncbi:MAG TPA: hypothetical protein VEK08_20100 [Planctomycetota bacterium]|nr:hypothetical protein [Planctomycetota bacterium]